MCARPWPRSWGYKHDEETPLLLSCSQFSRQRQMYIEKMIEVLQRRFT